MSLQSPFAKLVGYCFAMLSVVGITIECFTKLNNSMTAYSQMFRSNKIQVGMNEMSLIESEKNITF